MALNYNFSKSATLLISCTVIEALLLILHIVVWNTIAICFAENGPHKEDNEEILGVKTFAGSIWMNVYFIFKTD